MFKLTTTLLDWLADSAAEFKVTVSDVTPFANNGAIVQATIRAHSLKDIYDFDLTAAEAGHPSWTHTFAAAKATAKRQLAAKEAKEKAARDKEKAGSPATASVPKQ